MLSVALIGLAVGTLVGLTGVGGGSVLTPVLVLLGIPPLTAIGTDLVTNAVTDLFGTVQHHRQGTVSWRWVRTLAVGGVPAAILGSLATGFLLHGLDAQLTLRRILGVALLIATLAALLRRRRPKPNRDAKPPRLAPGLGAALGFLVGLTSVGGGSLVTPVLLGLSPLGPAEIVGTDIATAFLIAAAAGVAHAALGSVDPQLALNLLIGSVPGVWFGSRLTQYVPRRPLRIVVGGLVCLIGIHWLV